MDHKGLDSPPPPPEQSIWRRLIKNKVYLIIFVTLITLAILVSIIVPLIIYGLINRGHHSQDPKPKIITPSSPDYKDPFDDSARANDYSPPLSEPFNYGKENKVRGINLGGWLVLEPFITPSLFDQTGNSSIVDEWTLCESLGPEEAKRRLKEHYETFITEEDFKKIAQMGFNHVRIPTGHWAIRGRDHEPFVAYLSWQYLLQGIQWARKYGLRVMVELHTAPGSQNGWNHSGKSGSIHWLMGKNGDENAKSTTEITADMIKFFSKPEWANVVSMYGVLNEPAMMTIPEKKVKDWYDSSYNYIKKLLGSTQGPYLSYHDGFYPLETWKGFFTNAYERIILETHLYMIFDDGLVKLPREKQAEIPCVSWKTNLRDAEKEVGSVMVGEFSIATDDCAKYLNGVNIGARYDGTFEKGVGPACPDCSCETATDWTAWSSAYKNFLQQFMEKQMDAYEESLGWFYWTYKTEKHVNPQWDYLLAWEQGFAPKDVNQRTYQC
ncbi:glycoside hydrolase superfamily [Pilobolus umbonatus]|nr:glycoside hydrolase superfamily [Pilobolus umbonatus]